MFRLDVTLGVVVLLGISLVCGQFPFGLNSGKIFGYDVLSSTTGEVECATDNKHPGTCMSRKECNQHGGVASGSCRQGICCEISMGCGKVSRAKKTVIRNPSPIPEYCSYYFRPFSKHVCQLRIEINSKLGAPTLPTRLREGSYVQCEQSYLKLGPYKLCGVNKNQHIYLPFSAELNKNIEQGLTVVHKDAEFAATDYWDIVVTQIECPPAGADKELFKQHSWNLTGKHRMQFDKELIAPEGCLQYFTDRSGIIETFNFNGGKGPYLGNMRYAICFKKKSGDKSITFEANKFNLNVNRYGQLETGLNCYDPLTLNPRSSKDYLLVPDSFLTTPEGFSPTIKLEASKYCGSILQGRKLHYAPAGPFVITVNTDERYSINNHIHEAGFSIRYTINANKSYEH